MSVDGFASDARGREDWLQTSLPAWDPDAWPVAKDWRELVGAFFSSAAGLQLGEQVAARLARGETVYPPHPLRALELTPLRSVRVVILGQDPYHGAGQANGLAFSVSKDVAPPPSLRNIATEIARERQTGGLAEFAEKPGRRPQGGFDADLTRWAQQGVLLVNTCLTVEAGVPASHSGMGWEVLTSQVIAAVQKNPEPVVYLLWGKHAQHCQPAPETAPPGAARLFLRCNHPSPLSARRGPLPFVGCGHFGMVNAFLHRHGGDPIDW